MSALPEPDPDYGVPYIHACWALSGIVTVALIFRYAVKAWARWMLPGVSSPERVWGAEDIFYFLGYGLDITHIVFVQQSLNWGLGQHLWDLSADQIRETLKYEFISQPIAVLASMLSRCGMTWFLYSCFSSADKHIRFLIVFGMTVQVIANMVTAVQIVVQCGPNPYHTANRVAFFHYVWDKLPADGSVVCQSPSVQTTIGFVQGGLNSAVDFLLTVLSAMQLWQYSIRATDNVQSGSTSFFARFKRMNKRARTRRIWQTIILSGPLALSGIASIVKTYLLKSIGETDDITHKIIPFILWVKIENYSILLATCGPVIRLFVRVVFDKKKSSYGYWSNSHSNQYHRGLELDGQSHSHTQGSVVMSVFAGTHQTNGHQEWKGPTADIVTGDGDSDEMLYPERVRGSHMKRRRNNDIPRGGHHDNDTGVTIKTDITVQVETDGASTIGLVR